MTSLSKPMFPHAVDSTMLAALRSCPQKMHQTYMQHWKPKNESVHLIAGGAFAKGIEVARKAFFEGVNTVTDVSFDDEGKRVVKWTEHKLENATASWEQAQELGIQACLAAYGDFDCPPESAKSLVRTAGALEFYFEQYPFGADGMDPITFPGGRRGIEFGFAEPLPFKHPITGDPVLYTGRADMLAKFAGGLYIVDEKTTSSLGASWGRQWEMRAQFTGYSWACQQLGLKPAGAIIRGVSILKTKYDTQQAITYRAQFEIDRWLAQTVKDLERLRRMWEDNYYDYALDHACAEYGGCSMTQICKSPEPEIWLPMQFTQRVWDPLARKETTVEEFEASWGHVR